MKHEPTGEIIDWRFSLLHPVLWYFPMELTGRGPVLLFSGVGWGGSRGAGRGGAESPRRGSYIHAEDFENKQSLQAHGGGGQCLLSPQ